MRKQPEHCATEPYEKPDLEASGLFIFYFLKTRFQRSQMFGWHFLDRIPLAFILDSLRVTRFVALLQRLLGLEIRLFARFQPAHFSIFCALMVKFF